MATKGMDIETFLDKVVAMLRRDLNPKIDTINAEKGDDIKMEHVDDDAYIFQTMDERVANHDPVILYGVFDVQSKGIGSATLKTYRLNVVLIASDEGKDPSIGRRMLRYSRALEEVFGQSFATIASGFNVAVESLVPVAFTLLDTSDDFRAVGVTVTVTIA
jgi:hypothetical protein